MCLLSTVRMQWLNSWLHPALQAVAGFSCPPRFFPFPSIWIFLSLETSSFHLLPAGPQMSVMLPQPGGGCPHVRICSSGSSFLIPTAHISLSAPGKALHLDEGSFGVVSCFPQKGLQHMMAREPYILSEKREGFQPSLLGPP